MSDFREQTFPLRFTGTLAAGGAEQAVEARPLPAEADDAAALYGEAGAPLLGYCDQDELLERLPQGAVLRLALRCGFLDLRGQAHPAALLLELTAGAPRRAFRAGLKVGGHESWGSPDPDAERALLSLRDAARPLGTCRLCIFCGLSDYEPSTGYGHLYCFRHDAPGYRAAAQAPSGRKRAVWALWRGSEPVAETHACARFEPRPPGWGYRG